MCALLAGVVFAASQACGDEPGIAAGPLRFRRWRVESGLPLTRIPIFAQTSDGYLWLGAAGEGLFRFDGTRFSAPDDGLWPRWSFPGGNDVTTLFACRDGRLCVGTQNGLWTLKVGQWNRITTQDGLSNNSITAIDEGPNGDLWVGTALGLNRIRDHSVRVFHVNDRTAIGPIGAVRCDRSGAVWVGTAGGELYRLIDGHLSIVANQGTTAQDEINTIIEGREGSLWIATWNGGLTRWKDGAMEVFGPQEGLPQTEIFSLAEDRWGSIWIGTRKGLFVLSSAADGRRTISPAAKGATFALLRDREGSIWSGTSTGLDQYKDWRLARH